METCPKCNFALTPGAVECPACGVILAKLRATSGLHNQVRPVPPPLPTPPASPYAPASPPYAPANPYAPPAAQIEGPAPLLPAALPAQDVITRPTLAALEATRPWLRFLVIYGFVMLSLMLLVAFGLLVYGLDNSTMMPIAAAYFIYSLIGFAVLAPLHRSTSALGRISSHGASASLETFATEQSSFWRRMGVICVVLLVLVGIGVVFAILGGVLAAVAR